MNFGETMKVETSTRFASVVRRTIKIGSLSLSDQITTSLSAAVVAIAASYLFGTGPVSDLKPWAR